MSVCSTQFIRKIGNIRSEIAPDDNIRDYRDDVAYPTLVDDLNYSVEDELVVMISQEKENDIDGDNTIYYLRELHKNHKWLGDRNADGEVDESDVEAYTIDSDDVRHEDLEVTVLDPRIGKLEVLDGDGDPLQDVDLYFSYDVAPLDEDSPHPLYKLACAQLTAAYLYTSIEAPKLERYDIGDVKVSKQSGAEEDFWKEYEKTKRKIVGRDVYAFGENTNKIEDVFKHFKR